jgi:GT2 family glycosyltransferase
MTFYFSILTHNRALSLLVLLESIYRLDFPPHSDFQIFILDNASSLQHVEVLRQSIFFNEKKVTYRRYTWNTFMSGKFYLENMVLNSCKDQKDCFLIHLDDDVQLTKSWLLSAWSTLQEQRWDASGSVERWQGRLVFSGQRSLHFAEEQVAGRPVKVWDWRWDPVPMSLPFSRVEFAGHRALLVRMEVVARVRHDPRMLIGGEDIDYSLALRNASYSIGITHSALITHRGLEEKDAAGFRTFENILSSWRWFYRKWGFVRRNACSEAGVSVTEWLRLVSQEQGDFLSS